MIQNWYQQWTAAEKPPLAHPLVLGTLALPGSGEHYFSHQVIYHPTRVYRGDLIKGGRIERSIPEPAGFPRFSDLTIELADVDGNYRRLLADESARSGTLQMKLAEAGGSEATADLVFFGDIIAARFPPGKAVVTASDQVFGRLSDDIPTLVTVDNFSLPEDVQEIFAPILYGNLSTSTTSMLGAVDCPFVGAGRYLVARHPVQSVDSVFVWQPGDDEFEVVPPRTSSFAGTARFLRRVGSSSVSWSVVEEVTEIDGKDYTFTYLEFSPALPTGAQVRADVHGIEDSDGNLLDTPADILKDILTRWVGLEDTSAVFNQEKFSGSAAAAVALGYAGANATTQTMSWQAMISRLLTSFNLRFATDGRGRLFCVQVLQESGDLPHYTDLEILDDSFEDALPDPVYNRVPYRYSLIAANNDWFAEGKFDNIDDQAAMGKILNFPSGLDFHWVHSSVTAELVAAEIAGYLDLKSVRVKQDLSAPRVVNQFDLADVILITHYEGVATEAVWARQPFEVIGIQLDLDDLTYTVDLISRQALPITGGGPLPPTEMVNYLVPGPYQFGRPAYMSGMFVPQGASEHTRMRAIYTRDWGQVWTAVDTSIFATDIRSAQAYQRDRNLHVVTQEANTGRVAYHVFDQVSREWSIENEEVVSVTEIDSGVRSAEPIWHLSVGPMFDRPACDIVARANGEVVVSYMGGVRAEDDGTADGSDSRGPGFYWFATQFCRVRSVDGVWGPEIRIGKNWENTLGVYTASESHARAILGPDGNRVYFMYGTLGHEDPSFLGTYFWGYNHFAFSSLGPNGVMTHHSRWFNANINGSTLPLAGWLGRVESDATKLYGAFKGGFNSHRGRGFDWTIADLAIYETQQLAFLHEDIGRITTLENCLNSIGDANRPSMHVVLVDGLPVWMYLPWWDGSNTSAPQVLKDGSWLDVGSTGSYTDIGAYAFRHGGKKYYALFMNRANTLDHFELWSEDDLPVSMTLSEWESEFG